jgi:hypothetical protein
VLAYDIVNKPEWATFVETSGELFGTPDASDVGTTAGVEIGVSDGTTRATVGPFNIRVMPVDSVTPRDPAQPIAPSAVTIAGAPSSTVVAGQSYGFTPVVSDPSGAALSFSIVNRPAWATFNTATGALSGKPTSANVGNSTNIVISVSADGSPVSLPAFSIQVLAASDGAPTISGTPLTTVAAGGTYAFTPQAGDPDGHALTFSILNAPSWASFDTSTGELSGSPPANAAASVFSNIVISVSDGTASASLAPFNISVTEPSPGSVTLSWDAPTQNTNGTPLTDLAGFHIYYGTSASNLNQSVQIANPGLTSYALSSLAAGTWYFEVNAYTTAGAESAVSTIVSTSLE